VWQIRSRFFIDGNAEWMNALFPCFYQCLSCVLDGILSIVSVPISRLADAEGVDPLRIKQIEGLGQPFSQGLAAATLR
jgi:hypothetical protein